MERLGRWCRRNKALASLAGTSLFLLALVAVVASIGYWRTTAALHGEARERAKADGNASLAIEALDRVFERLSPARMTGRPQIAVEGLRNDIIDVPNPPIVSKEAAALLEEMLPFYDRLAQQIGNGYDLRFRTAEASRRVGAIRQRLGQSEEAVKAYRRAIAILQELSPRSEPSPNLILKIAQIHNELGRLFASRRQAAEARQSHLTALALLQPEAAKLSASPASRFELARVCFFLGLRERPLPAVAPRDRGGPEPMVEEQRDSLAQAVTVLKALSAAAPAKPEYEHLLALCYLEGAPIEEMRREENRGGNAGFEWEVWRHGL